MYEDLKVGVFTIILKYLLVSKKCKVWIKWQKAYSNCVQHAFQQSFDLDNLEALDICLIF